MSAVEQIGPGEHEITVACPGRVALGGRWDECEAETTILRAPHGSFTVMAEACPHCHTLLVCDVRDNLVAQAAEAWADFLSAPA